MIDLPGSAAAARRASGAGRPLPGLRLPSQVRKVGLGLLGGAVLFLLFEVFTRFAGVPEQYLPHATGIAVRFAQLAVDPMFLADVGATLAAWALGIAIALALGVSCGLWLGLSPTAHEIGLPLVNLLRPIPSVCIIPLAILVIGQGVAMKLLLVSYAALWPILINTIYGVHGADPVAKDTARCFGLPRGAVLRRIILPQAAPMIFTGLKISTSIGLVVLVSAELLAATSAGIGAYIFRVSSSGGNMDSVLAGAAYAGVLGVIANAALAALDRRWFGWSRREVSP